MIVTPGVVRYSVCNYYKLTLRTHWGKQLECPEKNFAKHFHRQEHYLADSQQFTVSFALSPLELLSIVC